MSKYQPRRVSLATIFFAIGFSSVQAREYENFIGTAPSDVAQATIVEMATEIRDGVIGGITFPSDKPLPMYWIVKLSDDPKKITWLVQIWQSLYCGSGGCETFILEKDLNTQKVRRLNGEGGILSERIAVEAASLNGMRIITNWGRPTTLCAHVSWNKKVYVEAKYEKYAYCLMESHSLVYKAHGPGGRTPSQHE